MIDIRLEKHKKLYAYVDGASSGNPGYAGIGIVVLSEDKIIKKVSECIGIATNNDAEYNAIIKCLTLLKELGAKEALIFSDSKLVVSQLNGEYKIKSKKLKAYVEKINTIKKEMKVEFKWIEREKNKIADNLAKLSIKRCFDAHKKVRPTKT